MLRSGKQKLNFALVNEVQHPAEEDAEQHLCFHKQGVVHDTKLNDEDIVELELAGDRGGDNAKRMLTRILKISARLRTKVANTPHLTRRLRDPGQLLIVC